MVDLSHDATVRVVRNIAFDLAGDRNIAAIQVMSPENSISLSIEEHRELGRELAATAERLRSLCDLVVHVYGPNNLSAFSFLKAMEAIDRLKWDLQHQAMQDLPGHPNDVFYR
jgi:hypothetical protein